MKPKPLKHKEDNTFKFESFHERLQKINISSINHLKRRFDADEEDEDLSFFAIAIDKWQDLNLTQEYKELRHQFGTKLDFQNLVQVVHRKDQLARVLIDGLKSRKTNALNANVDLVVALTRDIQGDIYPFFDEIYSVLIELTCEVTDVELIEAIFVCLTFLFKYLWKFILDDIEKHFKTTQSALITKKDHIVFFAAEVFSFIIKKSKTPEDLIDLLFESVDSNDELSKGVGRILFELIKGVNHGLYSKSRSFLDIVFHKFSTTEPLRYEEMMTFFVQYLLQHCTQDSFKIIWNFLLPSVEKTTALAVSKLIPLICQTVEYRKCKLVHDPNHLLSEQINYITAFELHQFLKNLVLNSIENLFTNCDSQLSVEKVQHFCQHLYVDAHFKSDDAEKNEEFLSTVFQFTLNICLSTMFEITINKNCANFVSKLFQSSSRAANTKIADSALQFLATLFYQKRPRPTLGSELMKIQKYSLQLQNAKPILDFALKKLSKHSCTEELIYGIIVVSNLSNSSAHLKLIRDAVSKKLRDVDKFTGVLFVEAICGAVLMSQQQQQATTMTAASLKNIDDFDLKALIELVVQNPAHHGYLLALDLFLSASKSDNDKLFAELYPILSANLQSFDRTVRLRSLHILTLFKYQLFEDSNAPSDRKNIFQICLDAELVPIELALYRERLKHVRKLDANFIKSFLPKPKAGHDFQTTPVLWLLGSLYENLTLLWKPTLEVIETFVQFSPAKKQVVEIMFEHFKLTTKILENVPEAQSSPNVFPLLDFQLPVNNFDHSNHRLQLLKGFEMFSDIVEPRNREYVELFFKFLQDEMKSVTIYLSNSKENLKSQDAKQAAESSQADDDDNDEEENDEEDEVEEEEEEEEEKKVTLSKSSLWKTYFGFMNVFAKFKNPKACYREPELLEMYLNMLVSPNPQIQKSGMNCLYTYNHDYLNKYKDNFNRLLDEKSFSSEIHSFSRRDNSEDNIIHELDRPRIIPTFLRILYGKMLASSGTKMHGKSRIDFLRSIILKTIASFDEVEQVAFMDLIFLSIESLIGAEYHELNQLLDSFVDIEAFIPLRQFQTLITTLESLMKHFGAKSQSLMRYMFKVLVVCGSVVSRLLLPSNRSQLKVFAVKTLKTFRVNCFKVTSYFFGHFDQFLFNEIEIDAIFEMLLNPMIVNLKTDSEISPSPLLKLFHIWSENPRYYCLLCKRIAENSELTPIDAIIQLYSENEKISQTSTNYITGMIENLLTFDSSVEFLYSDPTKTVEPIKINNFGHKLAELGDYPEFKNMKVNFGSILLVPYIKNILRRINENREKYDFTLQEINVLARLSFFVKDADDCFTFATLLLHSISGVKRPEEDKEVFTFKTLNHLAANINEKEFDNILALIIPLFYLVDKPLARRELGSFLHTLSRKKVAFQEKAHFIVEINAYDARFPEEPDFNRRIDAFKKIGAFIKGFKLQDQMEFDFIHLLLHNCSFFLNKFEDISLKELSSNTLLKVCEAFKDTEQNLFSRYVVNLLFLKMISNGLKHEKEGVRHEYIDILWNCLKVLDPSKHPLIEQLQKLTSLEDDEVDFWRNMKHIQLHRRARALSKLMQNTELLDSFSSKIFLHFLIPLATSFVQDPALPAKNMALYGAAVDSLATYLQHCSWYKYESTLNYYFNQLLSGKIDAKIAIKIIAAMLSKFAFLKPDMVKRIEKDINQEEFKLISIEYSEIPANTRKFNKDKKGKNNFKKGKKDQAPKKGQEDEKENDEPNEQEEMEIEEFDDHTLVQQRKIYDALCKRLLPMLHRCLHQRSETDFSNDKHHDQHPEDEEIQRIPIALAIVKLLKHVELNNRLFQANITSIFLRLCQFLQSRTQSIREAARSTLVQIMQTLGPKYFHQVFSEMNALLTRGYQKHILIFTVFVLLSSLVDQFQKGDLDVSLKGVIDLCNQELFGALADEKEVTQITTKTKEAQKLKSYDIYEILGKYVSEKALDNLLNPLKQALLYATKSKVLKKIEEALHKIGRGLVANKWLTEDVVMALICRILEETRPDTENEKEKGKMLKLSEKLPKKTDYMLISQKALRRVDQQSKINRKSHLHLFSNFALTCFRFMLKNNRLQKTNEQHCQAMEPTIDLLRHFLFSHDTNVITTTLFCFHDLLLKFPDLQSFADTTQAVVSQIFVLLKKYSGMSSDNSQLIALCFKSIAHFVNIRQESKLSNEEIAVLLSYAASEIEHNSSNATVYYLLGAIIRRKLVSKEMHQMMEKMTDLAITTEIDVVQTNAIQLSVRYLTEFPIEATRFKGKITRLVRNLEFKTKNGRIAAGTILRSVVNILPYDSLALLKLELFVPISARMVNEDDAEMKKLASDIVRNILTKLTREDRQELWTTLVVPWLECSEMLIWSLASKLCSLFLTVERKEFYQNSRLADCLPFIAAQLEPSKFKSLKLDDEVAMEDEEGDEEKKKELKMEDDLIFQHLNFVFKVLKVESAETMLLKHSEHFNQIFSHITSNFLLHPHSWIRCLTTQICGQLFSLFSPEMFIDKNRNQKLYLFQNDDIIPEITKKFCLIFRDLYSCETVAEQLVKNLVYVARVLILIDQNSHYEEEEKSKLTSLISRLVFEIKFEIKNSPDQFEKRIFMFKWIAAVSIQLGRTGVIPYLHKLLPPLCREELSSLSEVVGAPDEEEDCSIKERREVLTDLNKQVLQVIKKLVGTDQFVEHYNRSRNELSSKRLERKKIRAIEAVTNVEAGVKRKQRKHLRDRISKRKKLY